VTVAGAPFSGQPAAAPAAKAATAAKPATENKAQAARKPTQP
jgi:hypothetical protein